ncbi:LytTR family DNA-binding domain-containing protein [Pseudoduganella ginsengisoli]|uniref:Response regulator n=1 Tax=Pseudoduganella ginsengisoli TaxID=1462440 RepID=A0A6L6PX57_9BURK|nr:LytTR family DNA-binding domain-containing protein [Pseudoduganella ginsengisoli]MTW01816.1 response regulator [Pseudoduganella ginsengisoli]
MSGHRQPVRVLVADDETSARKRLLQLLAAEPDVAEIQEAANGRQAVDAIRSMAPSLVFLDVEMPELDGFGVIREVGLEHMPPTIFATAYDHYALAAFDANAMDYLLKPFDQERFSRAMAKARTWLGQSHAPERQARLGALLDTVAPRDDRLLVRTGESRQLVRMADILYVSAEGNYIRLHMHGKSLLMRERMVGILERLDPARFRRVHRSHIANFDHVVKLLPWFGGDSLLMMADGTRLTLSRVYREDALREWRAKC